MNVSVYSTALKNFTSEYTRVGCNARMLSEIHAKTIQHCRAEA